MATPEERKRPITRRRMVPISYTVPSDAIDETLRVSRVSPDLSARKQETTRTQMETEQKRLEAKELRRKEYRYNRALSQPLAAPMTDELIDLALQLEDSLESLPVISLGRTESERQALRRSGLLYTPKDIELALRLAEMHNSSFFGGMVAPYISEEMAASNPEYVYQVLRGDATVLPNAFTSALSFGTPSATTALANGVRQGWLAAGNIGTRVAGAATQGVLALAPVVTNPRWATTTTMLTLPAVADAANGERSFSGVTGELALLTALGIGTSKLGRKGYTTARLKLFPDKGTPPEVVVRPTTLVEKAPKKVAYPTTRVYKEPEALAAGATDAEKTAFNEASTNYTKTKEYLDYIAKMKAYRLTKRYEDYVKALEAYDKLPEEARKWRNRAWWAIPASLGAASLIAAGSDPVGKVYREVFPNSFFRSLWSKLPTEESTEELGTEKSIKELGSTAAPVIVVPSSPYMSGVNVDSLESVAQGIPYVPK